MLSLGTNKHDSSQSLSTYTACDRFPSNHVFGSCIGHGTDSEWDDATAPSLSTCGTSPEKQICTYVIKLLILETLPTMIYIEQVNVVLNAISNSRILGGDYNGNEA